MVWVLSISIASSSASSTMRYWPLDITSFTLHAWTFATILGSSACADALERRWQGATYPSLSAIARAIHSHRNFDQRCMRLYVIGKTGTGAPS